MKCIDYWKLKGVISIRHEVAEFAWKLWMAAKSGCLLEPCTFLKKAACQSEKPARTPRHAIAMTNRLKNVPIKARLPECCR